MMPPQRSSHRTIARGAAILCACVAVSCSSGDDVVSVPTDATETTASPTTPDVATLEPVSTTSQVERIADGPLVEVCPATIVVQTDELPDVAVAPLIVLAGPDPVVTPTAVSGPLTRPDGTVEDVFIDVRSGGPAVGFSSAIDVMADDPSITLAIDDGAAIVDDGDPAAWRVVASLTARSRNAIVIDPATYPDVTTVGDLAATDIEVRHFTAAPVIDYLVDAGALDASQLVGGFDGEPAAFVAADGAVAQQGDLLRDPVLFASLPQWAAPVQALAADDAGWADRDDLVITPASDADALADCLGRLIPIIQSAIVAYAAEPSATNATVAAARLAANPLSRLDVALLDQMTAAALENGVLSNGDDSTVGDIEADRLSAFWSDSLGLAPEIAASIVIDRFSDPDIGLP